MYLWCPGHHGCGRLHLLEKEKVILLINHQVLLFKGTFYYKEWQPYVKSVGRRARGRGGGTGGRIGESRNTTSFHFKGLRETGGGVEQSVRGTASGY